jgi:RimJ/RimL family protein N-acetyltransferase
MGVSELRTDRLRLRRWTPGDVEPFARINADPVVMAHFPATLTRERSVAMIERIEGHFEKEGYGLWALEVPGVARFIGFVGLQRVAFDAAFTPAVEVGWRLDAHHWGHGYATEAARACIGVAFAEAGLSGVVSMTTPGNLRSRRVMERIGMRRDPAGDFDHPGVPAGHRLRRHVLYRLSRD